MTALDLAAVKAYCEAASPGPWTDCGDEHEDGTARMLDATGEPVIEGHAEGGPDVMLEWLPEDGEFIAHARTDLPACVAEIERLDKQGHRDRLHIGYAIEGKREVLRDLWSGTAPERIQGEIDAAFALHDEIERLREENAQLRRDAEYTGHVHVKPIEEIPPAGPHVTGTGETERPDGVFRAID